VTPLNLNHDQIPRHVGIIMDGNGRWAKARLMPRVFGHRNGVQSVREAVRASGELGIKALTLYAFSDENWQRPFDEVNVIMGLLETYLDKERDELNQNNVQLRVIGDTERLSPRLQALLQKSIDHLRPNTGLILTLALSYSGQSEIVRAIKKIASEIENARLTSEHIDALTIESYLDTNGLPPLDLLIRTSGEQRLSNFLLWQAAYAELYFTSVHWPDFNRTEYSRALEAYATRKRRFGKTQEQIELTNPAFTVATMKGSDLHPC
jgi:undecaprenyl diphosphate synthase